MNYDKFTELRKMRGVSLDECADCAGITRQHLRNCIKNDTLKVIQVKKLCKLLRCKITFFFEK